MKASELTNLQIAYLCRELALLLHTGIAEADGLYLMAEESDDAQIGAMLKNMAEQMDSGCYLSEVFQMAGCFPSYITGLLKVGQSAGKTEDALNALYGYYSNKERLQQQIISSLTYPAILLVLMLVVIVILLSKVLPVFNEIYASLGGQLSGIAGGLLLLGQLLNRGMPILFGILAIVAVFSALFYLHRGFRKCICSFWNRRWGDRGISRKLNNARFAQALAMGLRSGMQLEESVEMASLLLQDSPEAVKRCEACRDLLIQGGDLAPALEKNDLLSMASCRLLALGIRGGNSDDVMDEIAARMQREAEQSLESAVSKVEPALILLTSGLVGVILLSVMLPLMNIMSSIG